MEIFDIEQLTFPQLDQIKGGQWIMIEGEWYWVEQYNMDKNEESSQD